MKTLPIPYREPQRNPSRSRPFAAGVMALAACVTTACSGRIASQAPLPASQVPAIADPRPWADSDPSLPSAAQVLKGRVIDESAESAPTF